MCVRVYIAYGVKYVCIHASCTYCITEDDDVGGGVQIDAYELLPAVNVLAQLPADFEENIVSSCGFHNMPYI